jgi:hypothetical protein
MCTWPSSAVGSPRCWDRIRDHPASSQADAWQSLEAIVEALVEFAFKYPGVYRIMRSGILTPEDADIQRVRGLLVEKIVEALQRGHRFGRARGRIA